MLKYHQSIEVSGDDPVRLQEVLDRACAITPDLHDGKMCHVVRRAKLFDGHATIEFTVDSTNAERAQAACRFFSVARELGIETGSIEFSAYHEWLDGIGLIEVDGEPRRKPSKEDGA